MKRKTSVGRQPKVAQRKIKDLAPRHSRSIKGGGKRADGTSGGNVSGGWNLTSNKTYA